MLLDNFIKEYTKIYKDLSSSDGFSFAFNEIVKMEKTINSPIFHPTLEIKTFFKDIKEEYKKVPKVLLLGNDKIINVFLNIFLKNMPLPLSEELIAKKMAIKYCNNNYINAHLQDSTIGINLFNINENIENIKSLEIFSSFEILKDFEFHKGDGYSEVKKYDIILLVLDIDDNIDDKYKKLLKKPVIGVINHKSENEEFLSQFAILKNKLNDNLNVTQVVDLNLAKIFAELKISDKLKAFYALSNVAKMMNQTMTLNKPVLDTINHYLLDSQNIYDNTQSLSAVIELKDFLYKGSIVAKDNKDMRLMTEVLKKARVILKYYLLLDEHYSNLHIKYSKYSKKLINTLSNLQLEYEQEIHNISNNIKNYLDSIIFSIDDNLEPTKLYIKLKVKKFLFFNKIIVLDTFNINTKAIFEEIDNNQSVLSRKYKSLISKVERFSSHINDEINNALDPLSAALDEWIKHGHYLFLQKKPSFISMHIFVDLEEFNLNALEYFTSDFRKNLQNLTKKIKTELIELNTTIVNTQKLILECAVRNIENILNTNIRLAKNNDPNLTIINSDLLQDIIVNLLPHKMTDIFSKLPSLESIKENQIQLHNIRNNNKHIIQERLKEIMHTKKILKTAIASLQKAIGV